MLYVLFGTFTSAVLILLPFDEEIKQKIKCWHCRSVGDQVRSYTNNNCVYKSSGVVYYKWYFTRLNFMTDFSHILPFLLQQVGSVF